MKAPAELSPRLGARVGGALYPVLILSGILLALSTMLPQVLVSASNAMRVDQGRDALLYAAESGIAMAEARLKRRLADDVAAGVPPRLQKFKLSPTFDNPDYGKRKDYDFEVELLDVSFKDVLALPDDRELHRYNYRLTARAWKREGRSLKLGVNGLLAITIHVDRGRGGLPMRSLEGVTISAINKELKEPASPSAPAGP